MSEHYEIRSTSTLPGLVKRTPWSIDTIYEIEESLYHWYRILVVLLSLECFSTMIDRNDILTTGHTISMVHSGLYVKFENMQMKK